MCSFETGREPRGAALVISMLIMAVLLLAGTTFLTISSTESSIALNEQVSTQALSLAGAGLQRAMAKLNDPATYPSYSGESNVSLGTGTFTVAVSTSASQPCGGSTAKDVVVTASVPIRGSAASVQIKATMDKIGIPFRFGAFATVPNMIVQSGSSNFFLDGNSDRTEKELWVDDYGQVDSFDSRLGVYNTTTNQTAAGRIGGNGDLTLDAGVVVSGSARAGDAVNKASGVTVSGGEVPGLGSAADSPGEQFPPITPPVTPSSGLSSLPSQWIPGQWIQGQWIQGHWIIPIPPGTYYWPSLTILSNTLVPASSGVVTIYVTGNVTIGENVTLGSHPGTNLRIIMKSDASLQSTLGADMATFDAKSNFTFFGGLYGRNANVRIGEGSQIYGSIIGRTVYLKSNWSVRTQLHYDQAMIASQVCGAAKYVVRPGTWREVIP
jgi:Tfp pilus assembly protein PilX